MSEPLVPAPSRRLISNAARHLDDLTLHPEVRACLGYIVDMGDYTSGPPKSGRGLLPHPPLGPPRTSTVADILNQYNLENALFGSLSPPGAHKLYK